jgi:hypothetical protein
MWTILQQIIAGLSISTAAFGLAVLAAISAAISAILTFRSTRISARSAQTQLYMKFREKYEANQMRDDLRNLRAWQEKYGEDFAKAWGEKFKTRDHEAMIVDSARRRVKNFFVAICDLYEFGLIQKWFALRLLDFKGIDLLYNIVEPLEQTLNSDYNRAKFLTLKKLKPSSGHEQPLTQIPTIIDSSVTHQPTFS